MTATCERSATYQEDGEGEIVIIHRRSRRSVINPLALVFLWALTAAFVAAAFVDGHIERIDPRRFERMLKIQLDGAAAGDRTEIRR